MRDDKWLDRADLDRYLTTEPSERHDVGGCDDEDCMACNGLPILPLPQQAIFTANRLRNLADAHEKQTTILDLARKPLADIPRTLRQYAEDLERAARATRR